MVLLVVSKTWREKGPENRLQRESKWFRIDLVTIYQWLDHHVRLRLRKRIRTVLKGLLSVYRFTIKEVRRLVRRKIQKTLHHYDEKNDPVNPLSPSRFLDDMHDHKKEVRKNNKTEGIHEDFPLDE